MFIPQFQVIAIGIPCVAIFLCWLVFSQTTFNVGLTPIIAMTFFIASLGLLFWVFFTSRGKAFARKYNKTQQQIASEYSKLKQQKVEAENIFQQLMNQFSRLSTFEEVAEWDKRAELQIHQFIKAIQTIKNKLLNTYSF